VDEKTEQNTPPDNHHEEKKDGCNNCSPFFACHNCSGFIISEPFLQKMPEVIYEEVVYYSYRQVLQSQYEPHLWQPPDLA